MLPRKTSNRGVRGGSHDVSKYSMGIPIIFLLRAILDFHRSCCTQDCIWIMLGNRGADTWILNVCCFRTFAPKFLYFSAPHPHMENAKLCLIAAPWHFKILIRGLYTYYTVFGHYCLIMPLWFDFTTRKLLTGLNLALIFRLGKFVYLYRNPLPEFSLVHLEFTLQDDDFQ